MMSAVKVLVVDADEARVRSLTAALEQEGCLVEWCRMGQAGLERLATTSYHACLISTHLPDGSGAEMLQRLHAMAPAIVPFLITEAGEELTSADAKKLGAYDVIVASADPSELANLPVVLREGLEQRHLKVEREQLQDEVWEHARLLEERNAELRRVNEELKRLSQVKSDLVSTVSHELRTPLATIKEFIAIIMDALAGPVSTAQREYLSIVNANVDRLVRLINELLDVERIEAGQMLLNRGVLRAPELLEQVVQSMRPLAASKGITVSLQLPAAVPSVFADADKLTQVLINLVSNAVKFTPGPGTVTITVEELANEVEFRVTDTGLGIEPEDLPKLFQKFQQFHKSRRLEASSGMGSEMDRGGTGLGLAISKRLVELHGGRIWAKSTPGEGSTFAFTLPKYQPEEVFQEVCRSAIDQAKRVPRGCFSIIVVTILEFQKLKTLYGLEESTRLLRHVEGELRSAVRRAMGDVVIRWQRGEILVLLTGVTATGARRIATRLKRLIEARPVAVAAGALTIPVMTATATYPEEGLTEAELLALTERRLARGEAAPTRLLVVDDEPKIRQFLKEVLELREYTVLTAASGPEALDVLTRQPVDCILLDVLMPVMDGYELYHLLKEAPATQAIPVIIVTAKGERKDRELGLPSSAPYAYVTKPFQLEELLAKIQEVLQRQAQTPAARTLPPKEVAHGRTEDPHRG